MRAAFGFLFVALASTGLSCGPYCPNGLAKGTADDLATLKAHGVGPKASMLDGEGHMSLLSYDSKGVGACRIDCPAGSSLDLRGGHYGCSPTVSPPMGPAVFASAMTSSKPLMAVISSVPSSFVDFSAQLRSVAGPLLGRPPFVYASPGPPAIYGAWAQAPGPSESDYQSALAPYADANQNDLFSFFLSQELLTQMATAQQHVPTTITAIAPTTIKVDTIFNCSVEICPISLDVEETTQIIVGRDGHLTTGTTADNIVGIEPGSALCLALNPFAVIVDPAWVGGSCGGQIAANRPSLAQTLDEQLPRTADQCNSDGTCTEYDLTYDRFNSRPNDGFVMGVQLAGTTSCPGPVAATCPQPSDTGTVVTPPPQPHALTVRFEHIDDDAYVWLGQPGANQDALCSAQGASSQSCDLTTQLQARGAGSGTQRVTLKIGNGGCFNSQGDVYVDVDGGNAWHGNLPSGTKLHCGWTYRAELDVDVTAGTVTQVDAHECRLATDCMN